ncbi:hypothetical protein XENOCAPTIV_006927 [Xenoophorus captivus]|uniref:ASD2 domain-containing protein n=1 Tax=Xenoophorus captivus TaxID=1517983 RepID=A0ABV0RBZ8_9TELE
MNAHSSLHLRLRGRVLLFTSVYIFPPDTSCFPKIGVICALLHQVKLCQALQKSVDALQREKQALCEEQRHHQALGASIEALIQEHLKTNEKEKYSIFIGDLERIVNLLLSLCSRLSRVDKSLISLERDELMTEDAAEERNCKNVIGATLGRDATRSAFSSSGCLQTPAGPSVYFYHSYCRMDENLKDSLHHKRSLLLRQTEDARELKENLDRRQCVVNAILSGYLTEAQLQDYRHFVSAKPSLLIRQRHLDDLIRQREEQLTRLTESMPTEAGGWSPGSASSSMIPGPGHSVRSTTVTSL